MSQANYAIVDEFLNSVESDFKQAESSYTEAGGYEGETDHPVKKVDDHTQKATEGFRSAENEKDVKEEPNAGAASVNRAEPDKSGGSASEDQLQIGTKKEPTGEDPSAETDSAKPGKEDGGTYQGSSTHPARTDNDELNGGKWSADHFAAMSLDKLAGVLADLGNEICTSIAASQTPNPSPSPPSPVPAKQAQDAALAASPQIAEQSGWELAGLFAEGVDKQAVDAVVRQELEAVVKEASDDADRVLQYLGRYRADRKSAAARSGGDRTQRPATTKRANPAMMEPPPAGEEAPMEGEEGDLLSAAGGGEEMPPEAAGAGAPPGGGDGDQSAALIQMLAQLGVTPEQLIQLLQSEMGGGGAGGPPPGAGGPPPGGGMPPEAGGGAPPPMPMGEPKMAADKHQKYAALEKDLKELIARSRRR